MDNSLLAVRDINHKYIVVEKEKTVNKDILILKDGTSIELEIGASLSCIGVLSADKASMTTTWDMLTEDNLSEVQVKNDDGLVVANYTNLVLVSETSIIKEDGTILTTFCLREKTDIEKRLDEIEKEQEVQDEAIMDVADVVSSLAEN